MQAIENILRNHNLAYSTILNSDSGFTNKVYITDQYVVKVIKDRKRYDKECWFYENVSNNFTAPMIVNNSDEEPYIIFERINGISLYKIWHTMDDQERERIISRIAEIVRSIHHIDATAYNQVFHEDTNWIKSLYSSITETALAARDILSSEICENINQFLSDHINCMKDVPFAVFENFDNILIGDVDPIGKPTV